MQPEIKKHLFDISQAVANLETFMRDKNRTDYSMTCCCSPLSNASS